MAIYAIKLFYLDDDGDAADALDPTPTITIINYSTGVEVVADASTVNKGRGFYGYNFTAYDSSVEYLCVLYESSLTGSNRYQHFGFGGETFAIEANVEGYVTSALNTYDPPTRTELTSDKEEILTEVNANETKIDALNNITVSEILDGIIEGAYTVQDVLAVVLSQFAGKVTGSTGEVGSEIVFWNQDTTIARITQTITDALGNRTTEIDVTDL